MKIRMQIGVAVGLLMLTASSVHPQVIKLQQTTSSDLGTNWVGPVTPNSDKLFYATDYGTVVEYSLVDNTIMSVQIGTCADLTSISLSGNWLIVGDVDGVLHFSSDMGVTWNSKALNGGTIQSLCVGRANTVLVGTTHGMVYSFSPESAKINVILSDAGNPVVWVDQTNTLITVASGHGLFRQSADNGETWTTIEHDSSIDIVSGYRYDDTTIVFGGYLASVFVTRDNLRTLHRCAPIKRYPPEFLDYKIDAIDNILRSGTRIVVSGTLIPDRYEMGKIYDSVFYSDDLGASWNSCKYPSPSIKADLHQPLTMVVTSPDNLLMSIHDRRLGIIGLYSSTNNASSWVCDTVVLTRRSETIEQDGLLFPLTNLYEDLTSSAGTLYCLARRSIDGVNADYATDVIMSEDQGKSWTRRYRFKERCVSILVSGDVMFIGTASGVIYWSYDEGVSFTDTIVVDSLRTSFVQLVDAGDGNVPLIYSSRSFVTDSSQRIGVIYRLSSGGRLDKLHIERESNYDRLTTPIVYDGEVYSLLADTDEKRKIKRLSLVTWNSAIELAETVDVSAILGGSSPSSARIHLVDSQSIWLSLDNVPYRLDRSSLQFKAYQLTTDSKPITVYGTLRSIVSSGSTQVCVMQSGVFAKNTEGEVWNIVARCGTTEGVNYSALDIEKVTSTNYLISGSPFLYTLTIEPVSSVQSEHDVVSSQNIYKYSVPIGRLVALSPRFCEGGIATSVLGTMVPFAMECIGDSTLIDTGKLGLGMFLVMSKDGREKCLIHVRDSP